MSSKLSVGPRLGTCASPFTQSSSLIDGEERGGGQQKRKIWAILILGLPRPSRQEKSLGAEGGDWIQGRRELGKKSIKSRAANKSTRALIFLQACSGDQCQLSATKTGSFLDYENPLLCA